MLTPSSEGPSGDSFVQHTSPVKRIGNRLSENCKPKSISVPTGTRTVKAKHRPRDVTFFVIASKPGMLALETIKISLKALFS